MENAQMLLIFRLVFIFSASIYLPKLVYKKSSKTAAGWISGVTLLILLVIDVLFVEGGLGFFFENIGL